MEFHIGVIKGDGIGPEIVTEACKVLDQVALKYNHKFDYTQILMGGCSIDACGEPLTDEAIAAAKASDAVLMGRSIGPATNCGKKAMNVEKAIMSLTGSDCLRYISMT